MALTVVQVKNAKPREIVEQLMLCFLSNTKFSEGKIAALLNPFASLFYNLQEFE